MSTSAADSPPAPARVAAPALALSRRMMLVLLALLVATAIWLPCVHLVFRPGPAAANATGGISEQARQLLRRHAAVWSTGDALPPAVAEMRQFNPEWDLMARMYFVLALANIALREPTAADTDVELMDRIIDRTLRAEATSGYAYFTLAYQARAPFVDSAQRSHFVDSEIALMLAARRAVREDARYRDLLRERVTEMEARMRRSPLWLAESYPDECWLFCNSVGLAAMRLSDKLDGTDHRAFFDEWIARAQAHLVDPASGLLIAYCRTDGSVINGPEGSSLWMTIHCLELVQPAFAREQYARGRRQLGRTFAGFGYAREWPAGTPNADDIDSGPVVPLLGVSAGSSGCALVAASSFGDREYFAALRATLDFAAFPIRENGGLRYGASNLVGDAVVLYASVLGPLWDYARPEEH